DYSLQIRNLPEPEQGEDARAPARAGAPVGRRNRRPARAARAPDQLRLPEGGQSHSMSLRDATAIAARLSLRAPQHQSLNLLSRVTERLPPRKHHDLAQALATGREICPGVDALERDFPSLCFALATGVGKTRLMGAFIGYLP